MPRPEVTFAKRRPTPLQEQASAMATTRKQLERWSGNAVHNGYAAFDAACRRALRFYAAGRSFDGDEALCDAARQVAEAVGEPFDLIAIQVPRRRPVLEERAS